MIKNHLWCLCLLLIVCVSCGPGITENTCKNLQEYTSKYLPELTKTNNTVSRDIHIFIDYSMSMQELLTDAIVHLEDLKAIIEGRKASFYRMGASNPVKISMANVQNEVRNLENYNETRTLLDKSLESIVSKTNQQSVFVSDFEMDQGYTRPVTIEGENRETSLVLDAWAKVSFKKWLLAGNQIDFFIKPYNDRKLFIVFFTPQSSLKDNNAILNRFLASGNSNKLNRLTFSLNHFFVTSRYKNSVKGFPEDYPYFDEESFCQNGYYESYSLVRGSFIDYIKSDKIADEDKVFLRKKFLHKESNNQLDIQLNVSCYDLTENINNWNALKTQAELDDKAPITFNHKENKTLPNIFQLKKLPNNELGIAFNPGLDPSEIDAENTILVKVQATKFTLKTSDASRNLLTWITRDGGFKVQVLYKSIYEAVNEAVINSKNKLLYAYILKL